MDELSAKAKIFESILQNEIGTFEHNDASNWSNVEIRLRQNHQYDAYLIPYIAELLIRLEWEWTTIANVEHLSYRSLCKEHKKQLLENMSVFSTNDPYALKNLCINLVLMLIDTGRSTWLETDNWKDKLIIQSYIKPLAYLVNRYVNDNDKTLFFNGLEKDCQQLQDRLFEYNQKNNSLIAENKRLQEENEQLKSGGSALINDVILS
jgi:hypothetical protein